jgi:hypothetical protein
MRTPNRGTQANRDGHEAGRQGKLEGCERARFSLHRCKRTFQQLCRCRKVPLPSQGEEETSGPAFGLRIADVPKLLPGLFAPEQGRASAR